MIEKDPHLTEERAPLPSAADIYPLDPMYMDGTAALVLAVLRVAADDVLSNDRQVARHTTNWVANHPMCKFYCDAVGIDYEAYVDRIIERKALEEGKK